MIRELSPEHAWAKYPAFYNAYPLRNETSPAGIRVGRHPSRYGAVYIDDYYGRIFDQESEMIAPKYGLSAKMRPYVPIPSLKVTDELRVPYRKIPIYEVGKMDVAERVLLELRGQNRGHDILARGQTRTYFLERDPEESVYFYGEEKVKEPSFLPSHLRKNFDAHFLKCMWQSQAAILLNDIGHDLAASSSESDMAAYRKMMSELRNSPGFILFALGIAQHYGLPSVGLDLTDRLDVACWFATHTITTSESGEAQTAMIDFTLDQAPTLFFFRCPKDAVFQYTVVKPREIPEGRPDHQSAWFGHVGWGAASNQLGSYLMCGFRLTSDIMSQLDDKLTHKLFPGASSDPLLKHFMTMRNLEKYEGEARRALQGIYYMSA